MVYKPIYFNKKDNDFKDRYLNCFNEKNSNEMLFKPFIMNIRSSMLGDLRLLKRKHILTNSCLVYSMWDGYKQQEDIKHFLKSVKALGITIIETDIHATGHSSKEIIKEIIEITGCSKVYIIHSNLEANEDYKKFF